MSEESRENGAIGGWGAPQRPRAGSRAAGWPFHFKIVVDNGSWVGIFRAKKEIPADSADERKEGS